MDSTGALNATMKLLSCPLATAVTVPPFLIQLTDWMPVRSVGDVDGPVDGCGAWIPALAWFIRHSSAWVIAWVEARMVRTLLSMIETPAPAEAVLSSSLLPTCQFSTRASSSPSGGTQAGQSPPRRASRQSIGVRSMMATAPEAACVGSPLNGA